MIDLLQVRRRAHGSRVAYEDRTPPPLPGRRPFVIPVFLPQAGCPHQCAFCNQATIAGTAHRDFSQAAFAAAVDRFLTYRRRNHDLTQLAFFGGNFLGLKPDRIRRYLDWANVYVEKGRIDSLRFSTRPDTISTSSLTLIRDAPIRTVELGVQSMDDRVLARAQRGHQAKDTVRAVSLLKHAGYEIGLQIMTGLPGDTRDSALATAEAILDLAPAFVRIYPALVLADSPLAADYAAGRYQPPDLAENIALVARMWLKFTAAGIRVIRMGLQEGPGLADSGNVLAGAHHPAFGERVLGHIFRNMAAAALTHAPPASGRAVIRINPRRLSVVTGPQRGHLVDLKEAHRLARLKATGDERLPRNQLEVDNL